MPGAFEHGKDVTVGLPWLQEPVDKDDRKPASDTPRTAHASQEAASEKGGIGGASTPGSCSSEGPSLPLLRALGPEDKLQLDRIAETHPVRKIHSILLSISICPALHNLCSHEYPLNFQVQKVRKAAGISLLLHCPKDKPVCTCISAVLRCGAYHGQGWQLLAPKGTSFFAAVNLPMLDFNSRTGPEADFNSGMALLIA